MRETMPRSSNLFVDARVISTADLARRYSRFVRSMRMVLPVLALGVLAVILLWPGFVHDPRGFHLTFSSVDVEDAELRMNAPRLTGRDEEDRPYTVTANSAIPDEKDANRYHLDAPDGDITLSDGTWVNVSAPRGIYDRVLRQLELFGPVALHDNNGYEVHAESALVDLTGGSVVTNQPVEMQGPGGWLTADRGRMIQRGRHFYFDGHVHSVFYAKGGQG